MFTQISTVILAFYASNCLAEPTTAVPSSCIGLSDGYYYLKLLDDDQFPIIYAKCSNEYMILDPSLDDNIIEYFNSFLMFHHSVAGPSNQYPVNWEGWFLPDANTDIDYNYVISPDCNSCEVDNQRQLYESKTVYMMTGTMFGCFWILKGEHNYDQDYNTYQCYYTSSYGLIGNDGDNDDNINHVGDLEKSELTDESSIDDWDHSGVCAFNIRSSDLEVPFTHHDACTVDYSGTYSLQYGYHLKPSIGTNGEFCVCSKPTAMEAFIDRVDVDQNDLETAQQTIAQKLFEKEQETLNEEKEDAKKQNPAAQESEEEEIITYLYQSDFEYGTYRITKPGRYVVMEDIAFNPNPGSLNTKDVNNDHTKWWPYAEQADEYPGAGDYRDPYFMGFWAAITIETHDVVLDLNDHEVAMDPIFYYQQRWFTVIGLSTQYFLPGQGIGFFGADPAFAENVVIKDGTLGLSSHHCIHGNFNKNILIERIQCRDFETHGIQLNGFDHVVIRNVEIGPTYTKQFFRGEYGHARALLPRLQKVADENPDQEIKFDNREGVATMQDIVDELLRQTNLIFDYVVNGNEPLLENEEDELDWEGIKQLFHNPSGLPNGAAMYGIFLNTNGASVLTYNLETSIYSNNAELKNIKVHDMRHHMLEYSRVSAPASGSIYMNPLHAPYEADQMFESLNKDYLVSTPRYKGSIMTDASFALSEMTDNWDYLQASLTWKEKILPWAKGEDLTSMGDFVIGCNTDAMIHSGKGLVGIRLDGVENVKISNVDITNLFEETGLGREDCGEYSKFDRKSLPLGGGHMRQKSPMQVGFSGNSLQGIALNAAREIMMDNINIDTLHSFTGDATGISIWPSVSLHIDGNMRINQIHAGYAIPGLRDTLTYDSRPNRAPMACGILKTDQYFSKETSETYTSEVDYRNSKNLNFAVRNIYGFVGCSGEDVKTNVGDYMDYSAGADIASFAVAGVKIDDVNDIDGDDTNDVDDDDTTDIESNVITDINANTSPATNHILIGTVIAASILFCGCITMGYIAYIYYRNKKKQEEQELHARLLAEMADQQQQQNTVLLQHGNDAMNTNERTPLIKQIGHVDRLNL